jgi:hypothetical protein
MNDRLLALTKITKDERKRFIILTDMNNEPDDAQTMVKLLLYSNEIDIEGMIAVTSCWLQNRVYPQAIVTRVQAYGIVRENLKKHAKNWPTVEYLLSVTGKGQEGFGMAAVGEGKETEGSEIILKALLKDDPRPLYFSINAGGNTLAQALYDLRKRYTAPEIAKALSQIRIFDDSGQDDAGAWINQEFPDVFFVRNSPQVYGLNGPDLNVGPQPWKPFNQFSWAEHNVRRDHGILGELFPQRIINPRDNKGYPKNVVALFFWFMDGGGTTGVLNVLNTGLSEPDHITWGGWGGRFKDKKCKIFAGESSQSPGEQVDGTNDSIDESPYQWNTMYPSASDSWYDEDEGVGYTNNIFIPLWRFRKDILFDFQAKMDWCVEDFEHANHTPIACLNGDDGERCMVAGSVSAGETVNFDASTSHDPDGDNLSFRWWIYDEAGTYGKKIPLTENRKETFAFTVPSDAKRGDTIHLVLEVFDDNKIVSLKAYRRIVLTIK